MKVALDIFGPHDPVPLAHIVEYIDEYDEEEWIYVDRNGPLEPETLAMVVDEGSGRQMSLAHELGLVEHVEMCLAQEIIHCRREGVSGPVSMETLVHALEDV